MTRSSDVHLFLRDLVLLLALPGLALALLLAWWRPWELLPWQTHPVSAPVFEARRTLERQARQDGVHQSDWHGLRLAFPAKYVLTVREPTLELLERYPAPNGEDGTWPAQMAFLEVDSAAAARFQEAAANCDLSPDRCWTESVARHRVRCQRSAGVPDPAIPWTPHLECHVRTLGIRVLINAPPGPTQELLGLFKTALLPTQPNGGA
jgi:hypothetical protein